MFQIRHNDRYLQLFGNIVLVLYLITEVFLTDSKLSATYPALPFVDLANMLRAIIIAISFVMIAIRKNVSFGRTLLALVLLTVLTISIYTTKDWRPLTSVSTIIAIANQRHKDACKVYAVTMLLIVGTLVILSVDSRIINMDRIPNERMVYAYGMNHPNNLATLIFSSICALTYAYWDSRLWPVPLALSLVTSLFCLVVLSSRTSCALLLSAAILFLLVRIGKAMDRSTRRICVNAFAVFVVLATALMFIVSNSSYFFYDRNSPIIQLMNKFTNGRPLLAHRYFLKGDGLTLFGSPYMIPAVYHTGNELVFVDSAYSYMMLIYGIVPSLVLLVTYIFGVLAIRKVEHPGVALVIVLLFSVYCLIEQTPLYLSYSCALLFLSVLFAPAKEKHIVRVGQESEIDRVSPHSDGGTTPVFSSSIRCFNDVR